MLLSADVNLVYHQDDRAFHFDELRDVLIVLVAFLHGVGYI